MPTWIRNALLVALSALLFATWLAAALWYDAGRDGEGWEKAQTFTDFDR
jgi:hypothetical protein